MIMIIEKGKKEKEGKVDFIVLIIEKQKDDHYNYPFPLNGKG